MHPAYFDTRFRVESLPETWPEQFVILAAWATTGQQWTRAQNEAADGEQCGGEVHGRGFS